MKTTHLRPDDEKHFLSLAKKYNITVMTPSEAFKTMGFAFFIAGGTFASKNKFTGEQLICMDYSQFQNQDEAYFAAIHEIGHFACQHHHAGMDEVQAELEASEWAVENLNRQMTDRMAIACIDALLTYLLP